MRLNDSSETAIRVLLHLTRRGPSEPLSVRDLADALGERSTTYLAKTVGALVRGGLLRSHRGARGGVTLARAASSITLLDIVECVQGSLGASYCTASDPAEPVCAYHVAMVELRDAMIAVMSRWTLAELATSEPRHGACKVLLRGDAACALAGAPSSTRAGAKGVRS